MYVSLVDGPQRQCHAVTSDKQQKDTAPHLSSSIVHPEAHTRHEDAKLRSDL
jgi:hypothetical protein